MKQNIFVDTPSRKLYSEHFQSPAKVVPATTKRQSRMAQQKPGSWGAVVEDLPSASLLVDAEGIILSANELAATLIERPTAQLIGQPLFDAIPLWRESAI